MKYVNNRKLNIICLVFLLVLISCFLIGIFIPTNATVTSEDLQVLIGGEVIQHTSDNKVDGWGGGYAKFEYRDGKPYLILNNFKNDGRATTRSDNIYGIYYNGRVPLNIELVGENHISISNTSADYNNIGIFSYAIGGDIIFSGNGSLYIEFGSGKGSNNCGIMSNNGTISIEKDAVVQISGTGRGEEAAIDCYGITVNGILNIPSQSYGNRKYGIISHGDIVINSGLLDDKGEVIGIKFVGNHSLYVLGGRVEIEGSTGILNGNVVYDNGQFTCKANANTTYALSNCNVINRKKGVGWSDYYGSQGETIIPVSNTARDIGSFKRVDFPKTIPLSDDTPVSINNTAPTIGDVLTATCEATDISYQWYRGETPITGATGNQYTLALNDIGNAIKVKVYSVSNQKYSTATSIVKKRTAQPIDINTANNNITINYLSETISSKEGYEVSSNNVGDGASISSLTNILNADGEPMVFVRTKENEDTLAGQWMGVNLVKRPDEPNGIEVVNASNYDKKDGKLLGTTNNLEYSSDEGVTWQDADENETLVEAGTYLIQIKATQNSPSSKVKKLVVGVDSANPYDAEIVNDEDINSLLPIDAGDIAQGVDSWINFDDINDVISENDRYLIDIAKGQYKIGKYFDISLFMRIGNGLLTKVSYTNGSIKIRFTIPWYLRKNGRVFKIIRVHNGVTTIIDGTYDAITCTFTFLTDRFSTYALIYEDSEEEMDSEAGGVIKPDIIPSEASGVTKPDITPSENLPNTFITSSDLTQEEYTLQKTIQPYIDKTNSSVSNSDKTTVKVSPPRTGDDSVLNIVFIIVIVLFSGIVVFIKYNNRKNYN